ncbi:hypothetical protein PHLCEN_2v7868 [Hermanssonia centrifuga]|uniref:Uncharacterized protein n=1 Tax=Hermanssonia centrifuga TaxID=98765 RepID=A0A2R6NV92_9APHY|nr:hypothetical protein PHLCEN_2v7868 [Hermanssonia centrifuga]
MASSASCPSDNAQVIDQSTFWDSNGIDWDTHRIGWVISGACAAAVSLTFSLLLIEYVADTAANHDVKNAIARKDKKPLPIPVSSSFYRIKPQNLAKPPGVLFLARHRGRGRAWA